MSFNEAFLWGSASAAYQIEGAVKEEGKGVSIWDEWAHIEGKTYQGTNGDIATDHFHRYLEDVALMKEMGLKAYRFSISWTRILPNGKGEVNLKGIDFYNRLIDALVEAGIEPVVTLYHWDLPKALQDEYGGWLSPRIVDDFRAYASVCFDAFADRVKYWIVINEPNIFTQLGYQMALHPPGMKDDAAFVKAYHHTALAHAETVITYKAKGYKGYIGSSIAFQPSYAASGSQEDLEAKANYDAIGPWWYMDAYYKGTYPDRGLRYYQERGIEFCPSEKDLALLQQGAKLADFMGINYYQTAMVASNGLDGVGLAGMNTTGKKGSQKESGIPGMYKFVKNPSVEYTDWDWAIDPDGLRMGLVALKERYDLPVMISENGLGAYDLVTEDGYVLDDYRIMFIKEHIKAIENAINQGVDMLGYMTWSFTDLLSWLNGFKKRYGFVYIDFEDEKLTRIKKQSFYWYKKVIEQNGVEG